MLQKRIPYIDLAAGIMILWMIVYHALCYAWGFVFREYWGTADMSLLPQGVHAQLDADGLIEIINPCVFFPYLSFFMPWFFYKSGQFFKKRPYKELLAKDSRKLLLTFVIWSAIGYVFYLVFGALQHSLTLRGSTYSIIRGLFLTGKIPINDPLWFLLTLFGVRLIANWALPEYDKKWRWIRITGIIVIGYLVSYACYRWNHALLPYWVANGAAGLAFFSLGYLLRDYESKWWLFIPCIFVFLICCFIGFPMVNMMFNKLIAGIYLLWIPVALCGIITFNTLCKGISRYVRIKPLELAGQRAMTIYVTHILILLTCTFVVDYFGIKQCDPFILWIILGAYIVFLPVLCYVLPKISVLHK